MQLQPITASTAETPLIQPLAFRRLLDENDISITEAASLQLKKLLSEVDDEKIEAIRIFVLGGGCSGMTYSMTFADKCTEYDKTLEGDGYKIYVDAIAHSYIKGIEIDFVSNDTGATFVFNNVFQTTGGSGTCGGCAGTG